MQALANHLFCLAVQGDGGAVDGVDITLVLKCEFSNNNATQVSKLFVSGGRL